MKIEILRAVGCKRCEHDLPALRTTAAAIDPLLDWREIDITQAIDYAVELGVMKPPAVAIDGKLAFMALPSTGALADAMRAHLGN